MKRTIPKGLYDRVLALTNDIAQAEAGAAGYVDDDRASVAQANLRALYIEHEASGDADPFLTEALADFTDDSAEAARLYALAIQQSGAFPGEPTLSKHIGLARAFIGSGRISDASDQIEIARREAFADHESAALRELETLANAAEGGHS